MDSIFSKAFNVPIGEIGTGVILEVPCVHPNGVITDFTFGGVCTFAGSPVISVRGFVDDTANYDTVLIGLVGSTSVGSSWAVPDSNPYLLRATFHGAQFGGPIPLHKLQIFCSGALTSGSYIGHAIGYDRYLKRNRKV